MSFVVDVENSHQGWLDAVPHLETLAKEVVKDTLSSTLPPHLKSRQIEMSVKFVSDQQMRALNLEYRAKDQPTNTLSFPQLDSDALNSDAAEGGDQPLLLGDVVVAHGVTGNEAREQNKSLDHHLTHLLVHGTLHLLGYDHVEEGDAEAMEQSEIKILDRLGIQNPYIAMDEDIKI